MCPFQEPLKQELRLFLEAIRLNFLSLSFSSLRLIIVPISDPKPKNLFDSSIDKIGPSLAIFFKRLPH